MTQKTPATSFRMKTQGFVFCMSSYSLNNS